MKTITQKFCTPNKRPKFDASKTNPQGWLTTHKCLKLDLNNIINYPYQLYPLNIKSLSPNTINRLVTPKDTINDIKNPIKLTKKDLNFIKPLMRSNSDLILSCRNKPKSLKLQKFSYFKEILRENRTLFKKQDKILSMNNCLNLTSCHNMNDFKKIIKKKYQSYSNPYTNLNLTKSKMDSLLEKLKFFKSFVSYAYPRVLNFKKNLIFGNQMNLNNEDNIHNNIHTVNKMHNKFIHKSIQINNI